MKIFITGATGFVGREIIKELHAAGHSIDFITQNARSASAYAVEWGFSGQSHSGNVLDASSLEAACKGMDAVVHLVGIISEIGESTFENIHTRGTQNMVAGAQKTGA